MENAECWPVSSGKVARAMVYSTLPSLVFISDFPRPRFLPEYRQLSAHGAGVR